MRSIKLLHWLPVLLLAACSCGKLGSGNITAPGETTDHSFTLSAKMEGAVDGDSVFIAGNFCKNTPENPNDYEFFGFVSNGHVTGSYTRAVWAGGESYTVKLARKHTTPYYYPDYDSLTANGVLLTAFAWSEYNTFREFKVNRTGEGVLYIDPERNDDLRRVQTAIWTNGIYSTNPDSLFLNDPMTPERAVLALDSWNSFKDLPCIWDAQGHSWVQQTTFLRPGRYLLRFDRDITGAPVFAGCHVGNLVLNHLVNGGSPQAPWWLFAIRVNEDGSIVNDGVNNLVYVITIGHQI